MLYLLLACFRNADHIKSYTIRVKVLDCGSLWQRGKTWQLKYEDDFKLSKGLMEWMLLKASSGCTRLQLLPCLTESAVVEMEISKVKGNAGISWNAQAFD